MGIANRTEGKITKLNTGKLRKSFPTGFKNIWRVLITSWSTIRRFLPDLQIFKMSEKYEDQNKKQNNSNSNKSNLGETKTVQGAKEIVLKSYFN